MEHTDRHILALKCDIWWQYFNDFLDNQVTLQSFCIC